MTAQYVWKRYGFNSKVATTTFELNFKMKLNLLQANLISF